MSARLRPVFDQALTHSTTFARTAGYCLRLGGSRHVQEYLVPHEQSPAPVFSEYFATGDGGLQLRGMTMGLLDGAVNGMVSRLIPAGFLPAEAFCLAQAAYIKEGKRAEGVPRPVLKRQDVSWEISQTLNLLGAFPMGPEAHRQRIILWERIFGRGSWHEPIDPDEIYGEAAHAVQPKNALIGHQPEQVLPRASRYFPPIGTYDVGLNPHVLPCFRHIDEEKRAACYLVIDQGNYGFFDPEDIESDTIQGRSPVLGKIGDITGCSGVLPEEVNIAAPGATFFDFGEDSADDIFITFDTDNSSNGFYVQYGSGQFSPAYKAAVVDLLEAVLSRLTEHIESSGMSN